MDGFSERKLVTLLCLTTHAAGEKGLPSFFAVQTVRSMLERGALQNGEVRDCPDFKPEVLERARQMLVRGDAMAEQIRKLEKQGWFFITSEDTVWPGALRVLGRFEPLFLIARGNPALLSGEHLAVAGSRQIGPETAEAARQTGRLIALSGRKLVSGGAVGVDEEAQTGALRARGSAVIVPAMPYSRLRKNTGDVSAMRSGRLLYLYHTVPEEAFSAYRALTRNHTIYAMGRAALVVASRRETGGTWHGAADCLKGGWSPVFALDADAPDCAGNAALRAMGCGSYSLDGTPLKKQLGIGNV